MPSGKDRLYHWAFILGPKTETLGSQGSRFHARERLHLGDRGAKPQTVWEYEERDTTLEPSSMLLARVMIAKVKSVRRLRSVLEGIPVRPEVEGWNCVGWIKEAFQAALADGKALGTSAGDWQSVRDTAMWYVEAKKAAHRYDGIVFHDPMTVATWDMMQGVELTP